MNNANSKISVIIPCFNSSSFIKECLDSVVNQTFREIEIIVINDGSIDGTADIIQKYVDCDSRIVFIDRENRGVGYSENEGIKLAKSEYVSFLDSDDYYHVDFLKNAYEALGNRKLDIVRGNRIDFSGSKIRGNYKETIVKHAEDSFFGKITNAKDRTLFKFPNRIWTSIYRRDFLIKNNIFWNEEVSSYNDNGFYLQTLILAENILYIDIIATYYRTDNEMSTVKDYDRMYKNFFIEHEFIINKFKERGYFKQYKENLAERFYMNYAFAINVIPFDKKYDFVIKTSDSLKKLLSEAKYDEQNYSTRLISNIKRCAFEPDLYYKEYLAENYKISIIVYVINSQQILRNTLDCILNQKLKGIEVIIIDDGSSDDSFGIIKDYARVDSRIIVLQQKNLGRASAENLGVLVSHGMYLLFLSAGQHINPNMLYDSYIKMQEECLNNLFIMDKTKKINNLPKLLMWRNIG